MDRAATLGICECGCGQPTLIATHDNRRHGIIKGQPCRFVQGHHTGRKQVPPAEYLPDMIRVPISRGYCLISLEDADLTSVRWTRNSSGYANREVGYGAAGTVRTLWMHRVILERVIGRPLTPQEDCDHRDGNKSNNQRGNLRVATDQQNAVNTRLRSTNTSGFKGVSFKQERKRNPWTASIGMNGKHQHIGYYATAEEAAAAYLRVAVAHFGEWVPTDLRAALPDVLDALGVDLWS